MDPELKQFLGEMESRLDARSEQLESRLDARSEQLESRLDARSERLEDRMTSLVVSVAGDLHTQMQQGFDRFGAQFDAQAARMDRQGALIQNGSRWINRMNLWNEKIDKALAERDRQIRELSLRLDKLEQGGAR